MVREIKKGLGKSGNLKIIGCGRQSSENVFILFKREKDVLSHEIVKAHLPPHWGLLLKERICSLGEQILTFKSNSQILSDTASTIKLKNKNNFFSSVRGYGKLQTVRKKSGKSQGILKWMMSGNPGYTSIFIHQLSKGSISGSCVCFDAPSQKGSDKKDRIHLYRSRILS